MISCEDDSKDVDQDWSLSFDVGCKNDILVVGDEILLLCCIFWLDVVAGKSDESTWDDECDTCGETEEDRDDLTDESIFTFAVFVGGVHCDVADVNDTIALLPNELVGNVDGEFKVDDWPIEKYVCDGNDGAEGKGTAAEEDDDAKDDDWAVKTDECDEDDGAGVEETVVFWKEKATSPVYQWWNSENHAKDIDTFHVESWEEPFIYIMS